MTTQCSLFASRTLGRHLARGLGAALLVALALWLVTVPDMWRIVVAVPCLGVAIFLMRGCPMCWLVGLAGNIAPLLRRKRASSE